MLYALDTSTLVFLFRNDKSVSLKFSEIFSENVNHKLLIPPIAYYETLRGFFIINAEKKIKSFKFLYEKSFKPDISEFEVMEKAAEIYYQRKIKGLPLEDADILIAAWCVLSKATLVTDNIKHFKDIDGLNLENWKIR